MALVTSAVLMVNLLVPKREFKTVSECNQYKTLAEKYFKMKYPVYDLYHRIPTLSCEVKQVKAATPNKVTKPVKTKPSHVTKHKK